MLCANRRGRGSRAPNNGVVHTTFPRKRKKRKKKSKKEKEKNQKPKIKKRERRKKEKFEKRKILYKVNLLRACV